MGMLNTVHKGKRHVPRRCMVHGVQGVGKSTFGASAENPIFIQTEDGLAEIDCASLPLATSLKDVWNQIEALRSEPHEFKTVVVDTLDWLERLIWAHVCTTEKVNNIERIGYGKGYSYALTQWRQFLDGLDALRNERGMACILLAHTKIEKFQTPEDTAYDRFSPRLHKLAASIVQEWCDEVFFATYAPTGDPRKVKTEKPERIMRTSEGPTHVAKTRIEMPYNLPFEWAAYDFYAKKAKEDVSRFSPRPPVADLPAEEPDNKAIESVFKPVENNPTF